MQHLLPNTTLQGGKYRIERVLGQGGFGNTYSGYNTVFDERVAIKEFFMQGINTRDEDTGSITISIERNKQQFEEQREKFKKEALRIRKLSNPHIIKVHDLFEENGTVYYVMDFVDGENLAERLKRTGKPMTEEEVKNILPQILDALKTVHDAGIWHLDLKPANIMIDKAGVVKLIDFGASKQFNTQKGGATTSTAISYTNGYAPREQMEQNYDKFGPWTDFYALGATLYTLLTNKRPPLPTDIDDDISDDKHLALPFPIDISDKLRKCILWLMNTNRNRRPQNVEELNNWINNDNTDDFHVIKNKANANDLDFEQLIEKANSGDENSGTILSEYLFDDSVSEKKRIVFDWIKEIAEQGDDGFQYSLAVCYALGKGTTKDLKEAAKWFKKSAENGNVDAQHELGLCYYSGLGVDVNYLEAKKWLKIAAENGHEESLEWLESIQNEDNNISEETIVKETGSLGEETILDAPPTKKPIEEPHKVVPQEKKKYSTPADNKDDANDGNSKGIALMLLAAFFLIVLIAYYNSNKLSSTAGAFEYTTAVDTAAVDTAAVDTTAVDINLEEYEDSLADRDWIDIKTPIGECQYAGSFDGERRPHGFGEAFFKDGRYYKGYFVHGNLSGDNVCFKYGNGDVFLGSFKNNSFHEGTYTIKEDGSYFTGTFKNGKPDKGTWYDKNNKIITE